MKPAVTGVVCGSLCLCVCGGGGGAVMCNQVWQ